MDYRSVLGLSIIAHGVGLQVSPTNLREVLTKLVAVLPRRDGLRV